jgi:hypothetical protein
MLMLRLTRSMSPGEIEDAIAAASVGVRTLYIRHYDYRDLFIGYEVGGEFTPARGEHWSRGVTMPESWHHIDWSAGDNQMTLTHEGLDWEHLNWLDAQCRGQSYTDEAIREIRQRTI